MNGGPLPVVGALVWRAGEVWLQRRGPGCRHAGLLELPGGKIEPGEGPELALARELEEEWGPSASRLRIAGLADVLHHVYAPPGPEVLLVIYHVDAAHLGGEGVAHLRTVEGARVEVFAPAEIPLGEVLEADRPLLERVRAGAVVPPF